MQKLGTAGAYVYIIKTIKINKQIIAHWMDES